MALQSRRDEGVEPNLRRLIRVAMKKKEQRVGVMTKGVGRRINEEVSVLMIKEYVPRLYEYSTQATFTFAFIL